MVWLGVYPSLELYPVANMPEILNECSGIVASSDSTFWMMNDSGNSNELFLVDRNGSIIESKRIRSSKNHDWEELCSDVDGNVYIGDFGDNYQIRDDYTIYKVENENLNSDSPVINSSIIKFKYSTNRSYDAEAMIHFRGAIYIFTKNREDKFDGICNIFKLHENDSIAKYKGQIKMPSLNRELYWVTAASISPDNDKLALLSSDKLYLITNFVGDKFHEGDMKIIGLETSTQKEAIEFISNTELIITDEFNFNLGGNMYYVDLSEIKL